jgi:pullulanase
VVAPNREKSGPMPWLIALIFCFVLAFSGSARSIGQEEVLVVHYLRPAGDYEGWTLWVWDDKTEGDSQELAVEGQDDDGLIFEVVKRDYGDGSTIGLLPKFGNWESKDHPDRVWTPELGDEVWILAGFPKLLSEKPDMSKTEDRGGSQVTVHYHRPEGDYGGWTLWTWNDKTEGVSQELPAAEQDDYGLVFHVTKKDYGDGTQIGLLPKFGKWVAKDAPDRVWFPFMGDEVWILSENPELHSQRPDISPWVRGGFVDAPDQVIVALSKAMPSGEIKVENFTVQDKEGAGVPIQRVEGIPPTGPAAREIRVTVERPFQLHKDQLDQFVIAAKGYRPGRLTIRGILDSTAYISDEPMGAIASPQETLFRVFAPTASKVAVLLYDQSEGGNPRVVEMVLAEKGLWEISLPEDLSGAYYTLRAEGNDSRFDPKRELIDPYSRCNTAHNGRGLIIHDETPVADRPDFGIDEAIIYELHLRDFTIDENSGVQNKGKYLGLTEEGTSMPGHPQVKTGLDHLVELGVNAVQIMPIQDFENDESGETYNWGYMPVHFNSPDGWYATEKHGPARVQEFKRLVDALHRKGIRVIMDVVYNHTAETSPAKVFSFNGLVPGYYYRLKQDGSFWNGSGTGNEFRSEAPMARKFILDSVEYWVRRYKVDGYRFDLMGLMDLETVVQIAQKLRDIDPNLLIHGEPWTGGQTPITPTVKGAQRSRGFSVFGDHFRDAIKGGVFDLNPGYVQTGINIDRIKRGIEGSINDFTDNPLETLNYVACHDNHTFWDRLLLTTKRRTDITDADRIRMDKMGAVLVLTSQGIPFIHSGQEMLRTKGGDDNSYNKPDAVNKIRWQWKMDHRDVFEYYRGLIALRKAHPIFRMKNRREVLDNLKFFDDDLGIPVPSRCIAYRLTKGNSGDGWDQVILLFNPNGKQVSFSLPEGKWTVVVDEDEVGETAVKTGPPSFSKGKAQVPGRSAMVLFKKED